MKRLLCLVAFVSVCASCGGSDDEGCPPGASVVHHEHSVQCEADGRCHGWFRHYLSSGELFEAGFCDRGMPCGEYVMYSKDGTIEGTLTEQPCSWQ